MSAICTVLLAAGNSSRFGGIKLLAEIDGEPLVRRAANAALQCGTSLFVVTGAYPHQIDTALRGVNAHVIHAADWAQGMGASIATAFQTLCNGVQKFDAAIICPADMPMIGADQFQRLIAAHAASARNIIASDSGEALGAPCLFPRAYFKALSELSGPKGARVLLEKYRSEVLRVAMPEALLDIDTPADLARYQTVRGE